MSGCCRTLRESGGGHIVNVSSSGVQTARRASARTSARRRVGAFTRVTARALGDNVRFHGDHMTLVRDADDREDEEVRILPDRISRRRQPTSFCESIRSSRSRQPGRGRSRGRLRDGDQGGRQDPDLALPRVFRSRPRTNGRRRKRTTGLGRGTALAYLMKGVPGGDRSSCALG